MTYAAKVRKEQDPDKITVASGGEILVESGGNINVETGGKITVNGVELDAAEMGVLNVVAGTVTASKAVVVDANKDCSSFRTVGVVNIDAGSSGVLGTVDVFPTTASKGKFALTCADQTGNTTVNLEPAEHGQATKVVIPDAGLATTYLVQSTAALTAAEANILDGALVTTAELNSLDASTNGAIKKYAKAALTIFADTNPHDTAIVLPAKVIITNVFIDVTTQEATGGTKTVDVGISGGDEDGLLDGVSVAATGLFEGKATLTTGGNETYFASTTKGVLMSTLVAGADVAGDVGTYYEFNDLSSGGATICYTLGSNDFAELVANVVVEYIEVP